MCLHAFKLYNYWNWRLNNFPNPPVSHLSSRLLSGELQDWELKDPPCGCSLSVAAAGGEGPRPLSGPGQYLVSAHTPELVALIERALEDAVSSGEGDNFILNLCCPTG